MRVNILGFLFLLTFYIYPVSANEPPINANKLPVANKRPINANKLTVTNEPPINANKLPVANELNVNENKLPIDNEIHVEHYLSFKNYNISSLPNNPGHNSEIKIISKIISSYYSTKIFIPNYKGLYLKGNIGISSKSDQSTNNNTNSVYPLLTSIGIGRKINLFEDNSCTKAELLLEANYATNPSPLPSGIILDADYYIYIMPKFLINFGFDYSNNLGAIFKCGMGLKITDNIYASLNSSIYENNVTHGLLGMNNFSLEYKL